MSKRFKLKSPKVTPELRVLRGCDNGTFDSKESSEIEESMAKTVPISNGESTESGISMKDLNGNIETKPDNMNIENNRDLQTEENIELDFGILHKILKMISCIRPKMALYCAILLPVVLNMMDASSDYSLACLLYSDDFFNAALIIIGIDYGLFSVTVIHYIMANFRSGKSWRELLITILILIIFHPFAPAISAISCLIAKLRGLDGTRLHYLTRMTSAIQGCAEAPFQMVAMCWMILTYQLTAPWEDNRVVCDTRNNCIHLGVIISVGSFVLSFFSLITASINAFQSSDTVSIIGFLFISLLFRMSTTVIVVTYLEVWSIGCFLAIFFVNIIITNVVSVKQNKKAEKHENISSGINYLTTIIVSIFSFNILPSHPTVQKTKGNTGVNQTAVKWLSLLIMTSNATIMMISTLTVSHLVSSTDYIFNPNIMLSKDQLNAVVFHFFTPLYVLVLSGAGAFLFTYNKHLSLWKKLLINSFPLILTFVLVCLGSQLIPPTPKKVLIAFKSNDSVSFLTGISEGPDFATNICTARINADNGTLECHNLKKPYVGGVAVRPFKGLKSDQSVHRFETSEVILLDNIFTFRTFFPEVKLKPECAEENDNYCKIELKKNKTINEVEVKVCEDRICSQDYEPICGEDGRTYSNSCKACGIKTACDGRCPCNTCHIETGVYIQHGNDVQLITSSGQEKCSNECAFTDACVAWTFQTLDGLCWLHSDDSIKVESEGMVTGTKECGKKIKTPCTCNGETDKNGDGECMSDWPRGSGNLWCFVDKNSNCSDIKPWYKHSYSWVACNEGSG